MSLYPQVIGILTWKVKQDELGHRDYSLTFKVASSVGYSPYAVLSATGLPTYGSTWYFPSDFIIDQDDYAYCKLVTEVTPMISDGDPDRFWQVTCEFTTRPDLSKCQITPFTNPLLQCPKISGHSTRRTIEATLDIYGQPILNSAYEQIRGPNNEWDDSRTGVRVEMNVGSWSNVLACLAALDYLNQDTLWGYGPRHIKLSNVTWEKKYYGDCTIYYTVTLDFDIIPYFQNGLFPTYPNPYGLTVGTWDRLVQDQGTKVLRGHFNRATGQYIVDAAGGILAPTAPILTQYCGGSGTLTNATYHYAITAIDANGNETNAPNSASITTTCGSDGSVGLTWAIVPGAILYNVYRNSGSGYQLLVNGTDLASPAFTDFGTSSTGGAPPSTNESLVPVSASNPQNFIQYRDPDQNVCTVMLNGAGLPADVRVSTSGAPGSGTIYGPGHILIMYYEMIDFNTLVPNFPTDISAACTSL